MYFIFNWRKMHLDRIKVSLNCFIGPVTLRDGWKRVYKGKNSYRNHWRKKFGGILFIYYPQSRVLVIDFSAPRLVYGHNLFDYKIADNNILFSILNSAVDGIVPPHYPSSENWSVSYIEFTKNYVYAHDDKVEENLQEIKKIKSLPHLKKSKIYETGIIFWNSSRIFRAYEKRAEMLKQKQNYKSKAWINFKQLRIETGYRNRSAIRLRFKTDKLGDLLQQHVLTKEINELNEKFRLPMIVEADFNRTNNRQRNLVSYQNGTYLLRRILMSRCSMTRALALIRAMLYNAWLNVLLQKSQPIKCISNRYWVLGQSIQSKSGWT